MFFHKILFQMKHVWLKFRLKLCGDKRKREQLLIDSVLLMKSWYTRFGTEMGAGKNLATAVAELANQIEHFPRALDSFSESERFNAPLRGIGSPNGIMVTMYKDRSHKHAKSIVYAGTTGDTTLNRKVFASIYALALASQAEPTLVSINGGFINLGGGADNGPIEGKSSLLDAVLGPAGLTEPAPGAPSLGMTVEESMLMVADFLNEVRGETGLVQVHEWEADTADQFEIKLREVSSGTAKAEQYLESSSDHKQNAGALHAVPLFVRARDGSLSPLQIKTPLTVLGLDEVYKLMQDIRREHMNALLEAGEKRKAFALNALREQERAIKYWGNLTPKERHAICLANPFVLIEYYYNFKLGIVQQLPSPKQIPTEEYEANHRPQIMQDAKNYYERFNALCEKLKSINAPGGKADVLSLKFLLDAMIRCAPLQFERQGIQNTYTRWVKHTSISVWAAIRRHAVEKNFDFGMLAADNVLYSTEIQGNNLLIKPYVLVDMNDYIARIGAGVSLVNVCPAGRMSTLAASVVADQEHKVKDLSSLYGQFRGWLGQSLGRDLELPHEMKVMGDELKDNFEHIVFVYTMLQIAKKHAMKGAIIKASELIASIRSSDLTIVYFWGAAIEIYKYFDDLAMYHKFTDMKSGELSADKKLSIAVNVLVSKLKAASLNLDEIKNGISANPSTDIMKNYAEAMRLLQVRSIPIGQEAKEYIAQLGLKDGDRGHFVDSLIAGENLNKLESQEFKLSDVHMRKAAWAIGGLSSIELLGLANRIVGHAQDLGEGPCRTTELSDGTFNEINGDMKELLLDAPDCADEISGLSKWLASALPQNIDVWGIFTAKNHLFALAEVIADEAQNKALRASEILGSDIYGVIIPANIILLWKRGYASALNLILKTGARKAANLGNFAVRDLSNTCPVTNGVVRAESAGANSVKVMLQGHEVAIVDGLDAQQKSDVIDACNGHGRLGTPTNAHTTVFDRIKEIKLIKSGKKGDPTQTFYKNREALIALCAMMGVPGIKHMHDPVKAPLKRIDKIYEIPITKFMNAGDLLKNIHHDSGKDRTVHNYHAAKPFVVDAFILSDSDLDELKKTDAFQSLFGQLKDEEANKVLRELMKKHSH